MAVLRAALAVSFEAPKECFVRLYSAVFRESRRAVKELLAVPRITSHKGTTPDAGATTMSRSRTKPLTPRDLAKIAFPGWRGRKVHVTDGNTVYVGGTSWSEGSRSEYVAVRLATGERCEMPESARTPRELGGTEPDGRVTVPAGYAIVSHSIFCGRDAGCTVTIGSPLALDAKAVLALDAGE